MFEVRITGTFTTGTTASTKEMAEAEAKKILIEYLKKAHLYKIDDIFHFEMEKTESEKL